LEHLTEHLLEKVTNLTGVSGRQVAARQLAEYLGAEELTIFIPDSETGLVLPAPGFPQALLGERAWHDFLAICAKAGRHLAALAHPRFPGPITAYGFAARDGSILVLLGGQPVEELVAITCQLLPMLAAAYQGERAARSTVAQAQLAQDSANQARQLVESLDLARRELQQALKLRDQFLSVAAHELRTPLTSIVGFSQALLRRAEREHTLSTRDFNAMRIINVQSNRMQKLIEDFFNQGRLQAGPFDLDIAALDLSELVRRTIEEFQSSLDKHSLQYIAGEPESLKINGDAVRLNLVLQNLLHNAVKYSPDGGPVIIRTWSETGKAFFSVSDPGIGIPQADQPYLFDRFFRASNATKEHLGGFGIGLFLAKEIVTRHGGTISVASSEGQGSTFTVGLPR
jgi:signal transduction histidine kinase